MATRKRRQNNEACSALEPPLPTLPLDLLLEIVARSDARSLVRCAAICRLLRRSILNAAFIQQLVSAGVVPQCFLARLYARRHKRLHHRPKPLVSLVYPATPAASSFVRKHLAPFISRRAADLLPQYEPVTTRRGLVVLRRRHDLKTLKSYGTNLCVYDPMNDARTFFSEPPDISMDNAIASSIRNCVLLTAADGIGCGSFLLLVAKMGVKYTDEVCTVSVQTSAPSDNGDVRWGPITKCVCHSGSFKGYRDLVVLPGGVIHWLTRDQKILWYDFRTGKSGTVKHPHIPGKHHLALSPDGRLRILAVQGFMISVWEQLLPGCWSLGTTIDTEEKLRTMHPNIIIHDAELRRSEEIRSNAVLLQINDRIAVILDLETKEMHKQEDSTSPFFFEVDLPARLQAMGTFS